MNFTFEDVGILMMQLTKGVESIFKRDIITNNFLIQGFCLKTDVNIFRVSF